MAVIYLVTLPACRTQWKWVDSLMKTLCMALKSLPGWGNFSEWLRMKTAWKTLLHQSIILISDSSCGNNAGGLGMKWQDRCIDGQYIIPLHFSPFPIKPSMMPKFNKDKLNVKTVIVNGLAHIQQAGLLYNFDYTEKYAHCSCFVWFIVIKYRLILYIYIYIYIYIYTHIYYSK